ncbi:MAG: hypothetical protein LBU09_04150 [Endomicrobium sp.]|jgi:hypothetical protein|nr:hypothetical protein [Endomicrobium sp.]
MENFLRIFIDNSLTEKIYMSRYGGVIVIFAALIAVTSFVFFCFWLAKRKTRKICEINGFTMLNENDGQKLFPQEFSIFTGTKGSLFSGQSRLYWEYLIALNLKDKETYFFYIYHSLDKGGKSICGIAIKTECALPYVKFTRTSFFNNNIYALKNIYKPFYKMNPIEIPNSNGKYNLFTNVKNSQVLFDFFNGKILPQFAKEKLNVEVNKNFIIVYKLERERPDRFANKVLPIALNLEECLLNNREFF